MNYVEGCSLLLEEVTVAWEKVMNQSFALEYVMKIMSSLLSADDIY